MRLAAPQPRFAYVFADGAVMGAVAREVVEAYGDKIMEHPVGTGPFRLAALEAQRRRSCSSATPATARSSTTQQPPAGDALAQAIAQRLKGKRLPLVDRVEVSIVEEAQPRWLGFPERRARLHRAAAERVRRPSRSRTTSSRRNLQKQGMLMDRAPLVDVTMSYFGMEHPVVGGYTPDKVALRRALALAYDVEREIALVRRGQAIPAQSIIPPLLSGYDPELKTEMSEHNTGARQGAARPLRLRRPDGDGWRDLPDGSPLVLDYSSQPDQLSRQLQELWKKAMDSDQRAHRLQDRQVARAAQGRRAPAS